MSDLGSAGHARKVWTDANADKRPPTVRIGVAASFTAEPVEPYLGSALIASGIAAPAIEFADYNQISQICLAPGSHFADADVVVFLWRIEDLFEELVLHCLSDPSDIASRTQLLEAAGQLGALIAGYCTDVDKAVVVSTPPLPVGYGIDHLDSSSTVPLRALRQDVEASFSARLAASPSPATLFDLCGIQSALGVQTAFDAPKWLLYHQPFGVDMWFGLGSSLGQSIAALSGPQPKVLALDCDNTLWGGIIGEDGIGGIEIGQSFPGSAFREFQLMAQRLKQQGVLLAIVSKNNAGDVDEVFDNHDGMVLRSEDVAAWRVNWEPKPDNLISIADELNLGLDSFVFVDDSDHEIAAVRAQLPEVACLQVPEDPADFPALIADSGLFRFRRTSDEDRQRTAMMLEAKQRATATQSMSKQDFLASLDLQVDIFAAGQEHIGRVAQLTNKTNQFNLTTIRRTDADIAKLVDATDRHVLALRVSDRFGDYGLVGVAILAEGDAVWEIDTLLMSCRVLGRGVETAMISFLMGFASERGAESIIGRYSPTAKNGQVAGLFHDHGFVNGGEAGAFILATSDIPDVPLHLTVNAC